MLLYHGKVPKKRAFPQRVIIPFPLWILVTILLQLLIIGIIVVGGHDDDFGADIDRTYLTDINFIVTLSMQRDN